MVTPFFWRNNMQRKTDSYSLKNASWIFKIFSTAVIFASMAVLAWSWYISLSVLKFHRPSDMCVLLGDDLWALAHHNPGLYGTLIFFQAIGYGGIFAMAYLFFQRAALRRRFKAVLLGVCHGAGDLQSAHLAYGSFLARLASGGGVCRTGHRDRFDRTHSPAAPSDVVFQALAQSQTGSSRRCGRRLCGRLHGAGSGSSARVSSAFGNRAHR